MIKLAVSGSQGRMGQAISKLAFSDPTQFDVTALLEHSSHSDIGQEINGIKIASDNNAIEDSDCLIEFTLPDGTITNLQACLVRNS